MAVSVGALSLDISANGTAATLADLKKVDDAGSALGAKKFGPNIDAASGRNLRALGEESAKALGSIKLLALGDLSAVTQRVSLLSEGMRSASTRAASLATLTRTEAALREQLRAGNLTLEQRITLEKQLTATQNAEKRGSLLSSVGSAISGNPFAQGIAGALGGLGIASLVQSGVGAITGTIGAAIEASNRFNTSLRVLDSTSKLTGVPLAFLRTTADQLTKSLGMTAAETNTLLATAVRFTSAAGRVNDTGTFMTRWLDLAASKGLSAAEAMSALNTTIDGNDDGLNRLGLANPSEIYKKWATEVGGLAGKLSDAQQKHAIVNEVMQRGVVVGGAYAAQMDTAQGAVLRFTNAKENFLVALGNAITGTSAYNSGIGAFTGLIQSATTWVSSHTDTIHTLVGALASLAERTASVISFFGSLVGWIGRASDAYDGITPRAVRFGEMIGAAIRFRMTGEVLPGALASSAPGAGSSASGTAGTAGTDAQRAADDAARGAQAAAARATADAAAREIARKAAEKKAEAARRKAEADAKRGERTDFADEQYAQSQREPVRFALDSSAPIAPKGLDALTQARLVALPVRLRPMITNLSEATKALQQRVTTFANAIGETIARSISAGFGAALKTAFSGGGVLNAIRDGFKAVTGGMLSGLGSALVMFGEQALIASALMLKLKAALAAMSPAAGIAVSLGIIAFGSLLQAAGGAFGGPSFGGGGGHGGGGSSSYSGPGASLDSSYTLSPRAAPVGGQQAPTGRSDALTTQRPFVYAPTIIGQNDPVAQRQIANMVAKAANRGIGP